MLADPAGKLARFFNVLDEDAGLAFRATFIVDPEGKFSHIPSTTWVLAAMLKKSYVHLKLHNCC